MADDFKFNVLFQTNADTAGAAEAKTAVEGVTQAVRAANAEAGKHVEAHGHDVKNLRMAATSAKEAGWAYAAFLRGDYVTALHEAKFATIGLTSAISAGGMAAAGVGALGLAIQAWEVYHNSGEAAAKDITKELADAEQHASDLKADFAAITAAMDAQVAALEKQRKIRDEMGDADTAVKIAEIDEAEANKKLSAEEATAKRAAARHEGEQQKARDQIATNEAAINVANKQAEIEQHEADQAAKRAGAAKRNLDRKQDAASEAGFSPDATEQSLMDRMRQLRLKMASLGPGNETEAGRVAQEQAAIQKALPAIKELDAARAANEARTKAMADAELELLAAREHAKEIAEAKGQENAALGKKLGASERSTAAQKVIAENKEQDKEQKADEEFLKRHEAKLEQERKKKEAQEKSAKEFVLTEQEATRKATEADSEATEKEKERKRKELEKRYSSAYEKRHGRAPSHIPDSALDDEASSNGVAYGNVRRGDHLKGKDATGTKLDHAAKQSETLASKIEKWAVSHGLSMQQAVAALEAQVETNSDIYARLQKLETQLGNNRR